MSPNSTLNPHESAPLPEAVLEHLRRLEARQEDLENKQKSLQSSQTYMRAQVDTHLQHQTQFNKTTQAAMDMFASNLKSIEALASQLQSTLPLLQHVSLALTTSPQQSLLLSDQGQVIPTQQQTSTMEPDAEIRPRKQRLTENPTKTVLSPSNDAATTDQDTSPMTYE